MVSYGGNHYSIFTLFSDVENLLHRFRGNLVVGGGNPFEEEAWQSVMIGNISFKVGIHPIVFLYSIMHEILDTSNKF